MMMMINQCFGVETLKTNNNKYQWDIKKHWRWQVRLPMIIHSVRGVFVFGKRLLSMGWFGGNGGRCFEDVLVHPLRRREILHACSGYIKIEDCSPFTSRFHLSRGDANKSLLCRRKTDFTDLWGFVRDSFFILIYRELLSFP